LLKVACSGPRVSRTRNLSVTSPILYHYVTAPTVISNEVKVTRYITYITLVNLELHVMIMK